MFLSFPRVLDTGQVFSQMYAYGCQEEEERKGQCEALTQTFPRQPCCKPLTYFPEPRKSAAGKVSQLLPKFLCFIFCFFVLFSFFTFFVSQAGINLHSIQTVLAFI